MSTLFKGLTITEEKYALIILAIWGHNFVNLPIRFGRMKILGENHVFQGVLNGIRFDPLFRRGGGFRFQITYNGVTNWQSETMKAMLKDYRATIQSYINLDPKERKDKLPHRNGKHKELCIPKTTVCNASTDLQVFLKLKGQEKWYPLGELFPNDVRLLDRTNTLKSKQRPSCVSPTMSWIRQHRGAKSLRELEADGRLVAVLTKARDQSHPVNTPLTTPLNVPTDTYVSTESDGKSPEQQGLSGWDTNLEDAPASNISAVSASAIATFLNEKNGEFAQDSLSFIQPIAQPGATLSQSTVSAAAAIAAQFSSSPPASSSALQTHQQGMAGIITNMTNPPATSKDPSLQARKRQCLSTPPFHLSGVDSQDLRDTIALLMSQREKATAQHVKLPVSIPTPFIPDMSVSIARREARAKLLRPLS